MPSVSTIYAVGGSDVTTTSDTAVDGGCTTSALANGVDYLVLGFANIRNDGETTAGAEAEARFGTTRIGLCRFDSIFGNFNTGDSAGGGVLQVACIVTGDGSSTLNMRVRRVDGGGTETIRIGAQRWIAIPLTDLEIESAEAANSDTAEVVATDATWVNGDNAGALTFTPDTTGDYLIVASAEGFISGTPGAQETFRARLRLDGSSTIGTETEMHIDVAGGIETRFGPSIFAFDVRNLDNSSHTIRWEFSNDSTGDAAAYRRSRVYALRLDAFTDYDFITDGGNIQPNAGDAEASNGLTFDYGTTDVLVIGGCSHQNAGTWGEGWLHRDSGDVHHPTAGHMWAFPNTGVTTANDLGWLSFGAIQSVTGSETWRLAGHGDTGLITLGRNSGNSASTRSVVLAIQLETPETFAELAGVAAGTSSVSGNLQCTASLSGTAAGTSTCTGNVQAYASCSGTVAGTSTCTAVLSAYAELHGTSTGAATCTGALSAYANLTGLAEGTSAVDGSLQIGVELAGTASGTSTCTANLRGYANLHGLAEGDSHAIIHVPGQSIGELTAQAGPSPFVQQFSSGVRSKSRFGVKTVG